MNKGKTKHKNCEPRDNLLRRQHGYDFGSPERCLFVASFDFIQALSKADIFACAYGEKRSHMLHATLPEISLIGKHSEPLKSAFQEFTKWGAVEDGDVVALTFIFLSDGGYLLGVGQDVERLDHRIRAYDRIYIPLHCGGSWMKKFDSRHPFLQQLANYKKQLISPLLFSAAFHPNADDPSRLNPNFIRPVLGLEPILKFEAHFIREDDVLNQSQEWGLLESYRLQENTSKIKDKSDQELKLKPKNDPKSFWDRRLEMLNRHFPIILARIRRSLLHKTWTEELAKQGVRPWQIEQAICNLILSKTIYGKYHYIDSSAKEFRQKFFLALQHRYELADSKDWVAELTSDTIRHQIKLDCMVLLDHFAIKPRETSVRILVAQLGEAGLLDG